MRQRWSVVILGALMVTNGVAEPLQLAETTDTTAAAPTETVANPWHGSLEPSLLLQSGNSDVKSFSGNGSLGRQQGRWDYQITVGLDYIKTDGQTSEDTYRGQYAIRYAHEDNYTIFNELSYTTMRVQKYDYIVGNTLGLERTYQWRDNLSFTGAVGVGFRTTKSINNTEEDSFTQTLRGSASWQINPDVSLQESASIETGNFGSDLTTTHYSTSVQTKLSGGVSAVVSFTLDHLSEVPEGRKLTMSGRAGMRFDF